MDNFEVKKVENCFKNSQTYEYKIGVNLDKEFIDDKLSVLGEVTVKPYRRPIFMITCQDNTKIKGIINSKTMKVSFEDGKVEDSKIEFEKFLNDLLK